MKAVALAVACVLVSTIARAGEAGDEQARGEALAKEGRYTEAIDAFKAADKLEHRASHACLIALAYARREIWPQAEIWLDTCHRRVVPGDALPEWGAELEHHIKERLAAANVAAVDIVVAPADIGPLITVSSFPPDETFEPRTIHLPPGHHVIIAKAKGYADHGIAIDITDKSTQHVSISLQRPPGRLRPGTLALISGATTVGAGLVTYAWMAFEYRKLSDAHDQQNVALYSAHYDRYQIAKYTTIGAWAIGGALLITGLVQRPKHDDEMTVTAMPISGGAIVGVGWRR